MNFSPYNVLHDQQSLQSGWYLYTLNKIFWKSKPL